MKTVKKIRAGFLAVMLVLFMGTGIPAVPAQAASGTVYTCSITGCYSHPVTGTIEDSGGQSSYEIGQSMVASAVYTSGILEVTDSGQYYVTIRMSLMGYTSNHQFWVQNVGDSGWMSGAVGTTGTGTDSNGSTADICIQVPSENCIIRCSMYVEPMGREVIFYIYPSNYAAGNNTDMNATMVTASTSSSSSSTNSSSGGSTTTAGTTSGSSTTTSNGTTSTNSTTTSTGTTGGSTSTSTGSTSLQSSTADSSNTSDSTDTTSTLQSTLTTDSGLTSAAVGTDDSSDDSTLSQAEGLSLSTAGDTETDGGTTSGGSATGNSVFAIAAAFTSSALILICAVAGLVYFFRRNWYRWGGGEYDDD